MTTAVDTLRRAILEDLRAEIDAIGESFHDLPMRRAGPVAVAACPKHGVCSTRTVVPGESS